MGMAGLFVGSLIQCACVLRRLKPWVRRIWLSVCEGYWYSDLMGEILYVRASIHFYDLELQTLRCWGELSLVLSEEKRLRKG
jgi:hypothetical protein